MISIIVLFGLTAIIMRSERDTKILTCTVTGEFYEMESNTTLTVKIRNQEIKNMNMIIDVIIPDEYISTKQNMINNINAQGKMKAESSENGIKLTADMNSGYFDVLGLNTNSTYNELKETLEIEGYKCN